MIAIGHTLISDDIAEKHFVCELSKCKGACCVEGDLGAPLLKEELPLMEQAYEAAKPYMTLAGRAAVEEQGLYILDEEGDYSTPTIGGRECAYAVYDEHKILKCAIEQAWKDGKTDFRKPISCHLYPIRISSYGDTDALNYDRWSICAPACHHGEALKVPVYVFLKEALTRKYGAAWYEELKATIERR